MKHANHLKRTEVSHLSLFLGVFVLSSVSILLMGKGAIMQSGVLDQSSLRLFRLQGVDRMEMFFYILRQRCFVLPILFLLATTYLGRYVGYLYCVWYAIGIGTIMGTVLLRYGVGGVFLILGSVFPQYLLYVPAFIVSIQITRVQRRVERILIIQLLLMELLVVVGCLAESYINPILMEKIIKLYGIR